MARRIKRYTPATSHAIGPRLRRRSLVRGALALLGLPSAGPARPSPPSAAGYKALIEPVVFGAAEVGAHWQAHDFQARVARGDEGSPAVRLSGVVVRTEGGGSSGNPLSAFCRLCPHELCEVAYRKIPPDRGVDVANVPAHPLLICPCHFSVFDPAADGALLAGPAFRGLYRFRAETRGDEVRVTHVEASVLDLLRRVVRDASSPARPPG